jgi:DNA polymerase alpha subunit A
VVDDGVDGYMDNGMDDWGAGEDEGDITDDEEIGRKKKCAFICSFRGHLPPYGRIAKKKGKDDGKTKGKPKAPPPPAVMPSISAYRPAVSAAQEDDFMSSLLGTMDKITPTTIPTSRKRKPSPAYRYDGSSSPLSHSMSGHEDYSSDGPLGDGFAPPSSDELMSPKKKHKASNVAPATERMQRLDVQGTDEFDGSFDDIDMSAFMDVDDENVNSKANVTVKKEPRMEMDADVKPSKVDLPKKKEPDTHAWLSVYDSLTTTASDDTLGPLSASSRPVNASQISALEPDGALHFYWLDYLELEGKLYFIGKLKDKTSGAWVSCCVTVEGLQRNLFVLPREKRVEPDEDGNLVETDIVPGMTDVYQDFDTVRRKMGISKWKAKFVKRKYAFGEKDVPKEEREWLKVVYGFDGEDFYASSRDGSNFFNLHVRTTDPCDCSQSQFLSHFWHEHQCIRAPCSETENYGPLLASNQESCHRQ